MKKIPIILCAFFVIESYAQVRSTFIVWNENLKLIENISIADSLREFSNFENNSSLTGLVYLVYFGNAIDNPSTYKFPYDNPLEIERFVSVDGRSFEPSLNTFFRHNDTLSNTYQTDTLLISKCYKNRDSLPDGHWYRYVKNDTILYMESRKSIMNFYYHGIRERTVLNSSRYQMVDSAGYVLTAAAYSYLTNKLISEEKYKCNVLIERKTYFPNGDLASFRYYNWGYFRFYECGEIFYIGQLKNQVNHGYNFVFTKNGQLCLIEKYHNGVLIEKQNLIECFEDE